MSKKAQKDVLLEMMVSYDDTWQEGFSMVGKLEQLQDSRPSSSKFRVIFSLHWTPTKSRDPNLRLELIDSEISMVSKAKATASA